MRLVVADASAIVEYLLGRPAGAERIITDPGVSLHVPSLCDVEVVARFRAACSAASWATRARCASTRGFAWSEVGLGPRPSATSPG